jgi:hypothetical protein
MSFDEGRSNETFAVRQAATAQEFVAKVADYRLQIAVAP